MLSRYSRRANKFGDAQEESAHALVFAATPAEVAKACALSEDDLVVQLTAVLWDRVLGAARRSGPLVASAEVIAPPPQGVLSLRQAFERCGGM